MYESLYLIYETIIKSVKERSDMVIFLLLLQSLITNVCFDFSQVKDKALLHTSTEVVTYYHQLKKCVKH
jgi:hypothetical protein